jgi:hypothetical protein
MYELKYGPSPIGMELDHLCKTRCCIRPDHLQPVSDAENVRRGSRCKLTIDKAIAIRKEYALGGITKADLARKYSVGYSTIFNVIKGNTWVTDMPKGV